MGKESYSTVKLPESIIKEIDKLIKNKYLGYRSRAEFVTECIRQRLEDIQKLRRNK